MWRKSVVTVANDTLALSVADFKDWQRIDFTDDDDLISDLIKEVMAEAESYCNFHLMRQTVKASFESWSDLARLPSGPVVDDGTVSLSYVDTDGVSQTVDASTYEVLLDGLEASIVLLTGEAWPAIKTGSRMLLTIEVGYSSLPYDVVAAIRTRTAQRYERRENSNHLGFSEWDALLVNYRRGV